MKYFAISFSLLSCLLLTSEVLSQVDRRFEIIDVRVPSVEPWGEARAGLPSLSISGFAGERFAWQADGENAPISFTDSAVGGGSSSAAEGIAAAIRKFVVEDSWSNRRNELSVGDGFLTIIHAPKVIDLAKSLAGSIRSHLTRTIRLELALVPVATMNRVVPKWNDVGATPWLESESFSRLVRSLGDRGRYYSALAREGSVVDVSPSKQSAYIVDYEMNQTGVVPVVNPVIGGVSDNLLASLRAFRSPNGKWFRVDVAVDDAKDLGQVGRRKLELAGDLHLVRFGSTVVRTTVAVPHDRAVIVGGLSLEPTSEGAAAEDFVAVLRARGDGKEASRVGSVRLLDAGLFLESVPDHKVSPRDEDEYSGGSPISFSAESAEELRPREVDKEWVEKFLVAEKVQSRAMFLGDLLVFSADLDQFEKIRNEMERLAKRRMEMIRVELSQISMPAADLAKNGFSGGFLDEAWREKVVDFPRSVATFSGVTGPGSVIGSVEARTFVSDIEYVSGGTGFLIVERGDPIVRYAGGGAVISLRADIVPTTGWLQLEIGGEIARSPKFERAVDVRESQSVDVVDDKGNINANAPKLQLDLPDEDSDRWNHVLTMPSNRSLVLSQFPDLSRPGNVRVLVLTAKTFEIP